MLYLHKTQFQYSPSRGRVNIMPSCQEEKQTEQE